MKLGMAVLANLSIMGCLEGNLPVIPVKFGEAYVRGHGNPEPSPKGKV